MICLPHPLCPHLLLFFPLIHSAVPCCFSSTPGVFLPQGLCTYYFLCLEHVSPKSTWFLLSHFFKVFVQISFSSLRPFLTTLYNYMDYNIAVSTVLLSPPRTLSILLHRPIILWDYIFTKCKLWEQGLSVLFIPGSPIPRKVPGPQEVLNKYLWNKCNSVQLAVGNRLDFTISGY